MTQFFITTSTPSHLDGKVRSRLLSEASQRGC
jgi:hypothetical protein